MIFWIYSNFRNATLIFPTCPPDLSLNRNFHLSEKLFYDEEKFIKNWTNLHKPDYIVTISKFMESEPTRKLYEEQFKEVVKRKKALNRKKKKNFPK